MASAAPSSASSRPSRRMSALSGEATNAVPFGLHLDPHAGDHAVDREPGRGPGVGGRRGGRDVELGGELGRGGAPRQRLQRVGRAGREPRRQRRHPGEPLRLEPERDRAAPRRRAGIDASAGGERRAAEVGDREPLDQETARIELQVGGRALGLDAGVARAAEVERERDLARPPERAAGERLVGERDRAVEIDLGRGQRGVEPRRPLLGRKPIGEPPLDGLAVELRPQVRRPPGGRRRASRRRAPAARRSSRAARRGALRARRSASSDRPSRCSQARRTPGRRTASLRSPLARTWVAPGARNSSVSRLQAPASARMSPRNPISGAPPSVAESMPSPILIGTGGRANADSASVRLRNSATGVRCGASDASRARSRSIWRADSTASNRGLAPSLSSAVPPSLMARSSGPYWMSSCSNSTLAGVAVIRLVARHGSLVTVPPPASSKPAGPRQHQAALEARMLALDPHGAVGLDGERAIRRIEAQAHPHAAVVAAPAAGDPVAVELAGGDERALALERAVERADVALEPELVERRARSARGVGEHGAAVLDRHLLERERVGIEGDRDLRHLDAPVGVDAERHLGAVEVQLRGAPLAAHQRAEGELDPERAGAQLGLMPGRADLDAVEQKRRRRQQPRVDAAGHPHRHADQPRRFRLEGGAPAGPSRRTAVRPAPSPAPG